MLGILYDVHGNLDALDRVLADADALGVDRWLLGGDYGAVSPYPSRRWRACASCRTRP